MPLYDNYPYTNFHEMNLDWVIRTMKDLEAEWNEVAGNVSAEAHVSSTPSVEVTGNMKTGLVFDFGLVQGPRGFTGAQGPQGEKGDTGAGLNILDTYPTLAALQSAHPTGSSGDAYLVGSSGSYTLYIWSTSGSAWVEGGALTSPVPATNPPIMDSTAAVGTSVRYSREDHVHPSDSSKVNVSDYDTEIASINNEITGVQQDIRQTQEDLGLLSNRVLSSENNITALQTASGNHETVLTNIKTNFGPREESTALYNHNIGDLLVMSDGVMYEATASISAGDSLVTGTNIQAINMNTKFAEYEKGFDLLWQNPDPTRSFTGGVPGTLVTFDKNGYRFFLIECFENTDDTLVVSQIIPNRNGAGARMIATNANKIMFRNFQYSSDGLLVQPAQIIDSYEQATATTNESKLIPYAIYGIR